MPTAPPPTSCWPRTPPVTLRMSASPHANGGLLRRELDLPDFRDFALSVDAPASRMAESTRQLGEMLAEIYRRNPDRFRLFSPDETNSNRLGSVFDVSDRAFMERVDADDVKISADGRVMEVLSEHNCHGWLEGYTLTGRHGLFATYEAFAMVSASQTVQHSKWLEEADRLAWRARIPSFNVLLTSTAWRNDHNGFSHQGPGLIQVALTHRGEVTRVYLPAGRQLSALGRRPLPALDVVCEPDRDRQAATAAVPLDRGGRRALRPRRRDLAVGRQRRRQHASRTSCSPVRATS